jgi:hypothetical protein
VAWDLHPSAGSAWSVARIDAKTAVTIAAIVVMIAATTGATGADRLRI